MLDVGMGKYQWLLLLMTGVGWFLDSVSDHFFNPILTKGTDAFISPG
jgi:hypothetical protein